MDDLDKPASVDGNATPRRSTSSLDNISMSAISFGGERYERVSIEVLGYVHAERLGNLYDNNWLRVQVAVAAGSFRVSFDAMFLAQELVKFQDELSLLYNSVKGTARFETLEGQLQLDLTCDALGSVALHGVARDQAGIGNKLDFSLNLDQTQVGSALQQLRDILVLYPVRNV
jgi:hypothetical protein